MLCALGLATAIGQTTIDYPRDYFRNPLNIPIRLAANFGELRPNHYHMGLDIRTMQRENLPVYAAADGYIARVVIEPGGFGQAIYLAHPNGYTTLYAHLNAFFPALDAWVKTRQYKLERWECSLDIPAGLFSVKKGDQIALSGNRGGSQGPHLHFEIRRTADDTNLNPLLFGMPVPDNTSPGILRLAVYDRTVSTYEQKPVIYPVHKQAAAAKAAGPASYIPSAALITLASPRASFAISAFDTQTGSANPNGIYMAALFDNERPVISFRMNDISYNDTRGINAHIDYKTRATGGPWLQHLSQLPGYATRSIYHPSAAGLDGVVDCSDGAVHAIRIEVRDVDGNISQLRFKVQCPADRLNSRGAPASGKLFTPGMLDASETEDCAFYLGEKSLYDSVHIDQHMAGFPGAGHSLPNAVSAMHSIGATYIPLQESMLVRLRPNTGWTDTSTAHVVMVGVAGDRKDVQRPDWQGGWASARFRSFGNFQLVRDDEAPVITPLVTTAKNISFYVKDNLGAIRNVRPVLDPTPAGAGGQWLCFTNDKGLAYIYTFDEHCPPGKHTLKIEASDVAGNKSVVTYTFTR
jgi:hypothetical protein